MNPSAEMLEETPVEAKAKLIDLTDILIGSGIAIVAAGLGLIYWPVVIVFIGACILAAGISRSR